MNEPMTMATDFAMALAAAYFAIRLWRANRPWALAFFCTAAGSILAGIHHGFGIEGLWKPTVYVVGLGSFFLLLPLLPVVALLKFMVYATWMINHDEFLYVIVDYGLTLVVLAIMCRRNRWIVSSVAVSVVAAIVQQSGIDLHRHFNHNDLFHVIQLVALWLLYRGGQLMTPAKGQSPIPPT